MSEDPQRTPADEYVPADDAVIGRAFRRSMALVLVLAICIGAILVMVSLRPEPEEAIIPKDPGEIRGLQSDRAAIPPVRFTDITTEAGIDFVHFNGATGEKMLPETMGGGVAFFDSNNNGHPDLLFINSAPWPWDAPFLEGGGKGVGAAKEQADSRQPPAEGVRGPQTHSIASGDPTNRDSNATGGPHSPTMRLYRNDGTGNFADVTVESGLDVTFYGMGAAVGDHNNDGNVDVFITAVGPNHFFRNLGGYFEDATEKAGLAGDDHEWSTSAGFFDMNNNGWLDLFVCNYVRWSREIDLELDFTLNGIDRAYGPPTNYGGAHNYLYRNNGDETFTDISEEAGLHVNNPATGQPMGKALALAIMDFDNDGLLDVYVANDTVQNFLFRNQGGERFAEVGTRAGAAFASDGSATGAMGIDAAHFRNDEAIAVAIGNFSNEMSSFYVSEDWRLRFNDDAIIEGIGSPTRLPLTFGVFFFDYDLDGRLDYLQANGHIEDTINQIQASQHYRLPGQLFWNAGPEAPSAYLEVPREKTGDLATPIVGRGAAYADIDGDGDLDVILTQIAGPPLLLRNDQDLGRNWLRVKLSGDGETINRDAIGACIELTAGGVTQRRMVMPTKSYLAQVELPVTFGLGEADQIDSLRIIWPGGRVQEVAPPPVNRLIEITFDGSA